jgi:hypothetical protein
LDLEGNQAVDTLFYSADDPEERYSAVDTIRRQANLYLGTGTQLISTEGNPMLTIMALARRTAHAIRDGAPATGGSRER